MGNNKIQDLRQLLFDTVREVRTNEMPLDKAKVICDVAQCIINSVKVEVDFIKAVNATEGSGFIELNNKP